MSMRIEPTGRAIARTPRPRGRAVARRVTPGIAPLRWVLVLLIVALAGSMLVTSTVHARELPGSVALDCSGTASNDAAGVDGDQEREAPAGKAMSVQHATCHAPAASMPAPAIQPPMLTTARTARATRASAEAPLDLIHRDIRPPIA